MVSVHAYFLNIRVFKFCSMRVKFITKAVTNKLGSPTIARVVELCGIHFAVVLVYTTERNKAAGIALFPYAAIFLELPAIIAREHTVETGPETHCFTCG